MGGDRVVLPVRLAVLLRVVRVVLGRDLKQRGESGRVRLDAVSYLLGDLAARQQPPLPTLTWSNVRAG